MKEDELAKPGLLWASFVLALLFGRSVRPTFENPNTLTPPVGFSPDDLQLVVEEGRRQQQAQLDAFRHTTSRAQLLVTISLAAVAFWVGVFSLVGDTQAWERVVSGGLWVLGGAGLILGLAAAGGVVVASAPFAQTDTTQLARAPGVEHLAREYAELVRIGEVTVADRLTAFRQATRLVVWGVLVSAAASVVAL
jgi:hypothetical protein